MTRTGGRGLASQGAYSKKIIYVESLYHHKYKIFVTFVMKDRVFFLDNV